jgi:anti-sigma B factor antagonist
MAAQGEVDVTTRRDGETTVVRVVGAVDIASARLFDDAVMAALAEGPRALIVDLRRANHFDSSGVRVLVRAMRRSRTSDVELSLCLGDRSPIRKVLELSGVAGAVPLVNDC